MNRIISFIFLMIITSCSKKDTLDYSYDYISIVYMSGNNNLRDDIENAIIKLQKGYTNNDTKKIIVYVKTNDNYSHILDIKYNLHNQIISDTIKTYSNKNASYPIHFKEVIHDIKEKYPSNKYSLVLSSHATAWYPPKDVKYRSFGLDSNKELSIKDLNNCLRGINLEYIIFDACYMSSIEVIYELKDRTKYIIASPSEVISYGFPYDKIGNNLFSTDMDLKRICDEYVDYYEKLNGKFRSANIALINTSNLTEVIQDLNNIFQKIDINKLSVNNVQSLVFDTSVDIEAYDLLDFLNKNIDNDIITSEFLSRIILYNRSTQTFNGNPVNYFSGLSIYFPRTNNLVYTEYYKTYSFYHDSGISTLYEKLN